MILGVGIDIKDQFKVSHLYYVIRLPHLKRKACSYRYANIAKIKSLNYCKITLVLMYCLQRWVINPQNKQKTKKIDREFHVF